MLAPRDRGPVVVRPVCLADRLLTENYYNTFALMDIMKKVFKPKGKLTIRDWGDGLIIFSFEDSIDREWVLRN
ncbi:hypothetical protein ACS0TY_010200 [Phlomoides rotata]